MLSWPESVFVNNYHLPDRFSRVWIGQRNLVLRCAESIHRSVPLLCSCLLLAFGGWFAVPASLAADTNSARQLADLSLEQLLNETVTSVSKKEQRIADAAAAIAVLSNDDLRRSGATSVPEALRSVPGLNVSGFNSSQWAISARGFNGIYANKLLVLVDGRAVYTPLFGGVYWDLQQSMLADLDRIEVIRGPGATVWGANAVNGVINVVSRSARDTQGGYAYAGGGDIHQAMAGARYGMPTGSNTFLRIFGSYQLNNDYPLADGSSANNGWSGETAGFRLDHYRDENTQATWQGDFTGSDYSDHASDSYNLNTLGRWTQTLSDRSSYEVQAYYDRTYRNDAQRVCSTTDTIDLTFQNTFGLGEHHDLIWGVGYRFINDQLSPTTPLVILTEGSVSQDLVSAFIQDDWKVVPDRLTVTLGTKLEHNDFTGLEVQPNLRAVFKPAENQTLWGAISRAVRTPSEVGGMSLGGIVAGQPFPGPGGTNYLPVLVGNEAVKSETLWAYELGYRIQASSRINAEINAYFNDYDRLINVGPVTQFVPGPPAFARIPFANYEEGDTYGGEVAVTFAATESWRLTASYALFRAQIHSLSAATIPEATEEGTPRNQVLLRSSYDFSERLSFDVQGRYVDNQRGVPSYLTADVHLSYRPSSRWELSLVGQNLFDKQHPEFRSAILIQPAEVPRSFYGKVTWRF